MIKQENCESKMLPNVEVDLLGRRITCMTSTSIIEAIHRACVEKKKITVSHYNVHSFNLSMQLPWLYEFLQSADIVHCDSMGVLNAIRYMGVDLPIDYRVSYTILMPQLLEHCDQHGLSVFLLGSKPERLQASLELTRAQYPNIRLAGHHGYFSADDPQQNDAVIEQINAAKPQILVIGMGMPLQENWLRLYGHRLAVNAMLTGGAVIDRLAGVVSDCPQLLANMNLEWLYRLCREPKRLSTRYLLGNPAFVFQLCLAKFYAPPAKVKVMDNRPAHIGREHMGVNLREGEGKGSRMKDNDSPCSSPQAHEPKPSLEFCQS